jgi:hypothetical protein
MTNIPCVFDVPVACCILDSAMFSCFRLKRSLRNTSSTAPFTTNVNVGSRRVVVVGGNGVFGSKLVENLRQSHVDVCVAGRHSGDVRLNRETATSEDVRKLGAKIVVDAAGPFARDNYAFARAVIEAGCHYVDLADGRDYVRDFGSLNDAAVRHNVSATSGASSTPALTHAAFDELTAGWTSLDTVIAGISPGNKAPRGLAVMKSILSWVNQPVRVFSDGQWRVEHTWSTSSAVEFPGIVGRRWVALAETPDLDLLVQECKPREEARFMAGLELPPLHFGLWGVGKLRSVGVTSLLPLARTLKFVADLFMPFGSDVGGMLVVAMGRDASNTPAFARFSLVAPAGVGPNVPGLPAVAVVRKLLSDGIPCGARACVGVLALKDLKNDFDRLRISTKVERSQLTTPVSLSHALFCGVMFATECCSHS